MSKLHIIIHLIKTNGPFWSFLYFIERITIKFTLFFHRKRIQFETKNALDGFNTTLYNYKEWNNYDWSKGGEEWNSSEEWKDRLVNKIIDIYISSKGNILEIGPGAARWSKVLAPKASQLRLVDLTERSIQICKDSLKQFDHCMFYVNNGNDLSFIKDASIDYLWSFDVFVHIAPSDIEMYIKACERIFKPNAVGLIHHSIGGTNSIGFRSSLTNEVFLDILKRYNFKVIDQIAKWGNGSNYRLPENDVITVFCKNEGDCKL